MIQLYKLCQEYETKSISQISIAALSKEEVTTQENNKALIYNLIPSQSNFLYQAVFKSFYKFYRKLLSQDFTY